MIPARRPSRMAVCGKPHVVILFTGIRACWFGATADSGIVRIDSSPGSGVHPVA